MMVTIDLILGFSGSVDVMDTLFATVGILLGAILIISGLLRIAPQVKIHAIQKNSRGSWLFRIGAALTIVGLAVNLLSASDDALQNIGMVTGVCGLMGGIITWGHERKQALDNGAQHWNWQASLTLEMMLLGGTILVFGLIG